MVLEGKQSKGAYPVRGIQKKYPGGQRLREGADSPRGRDCIRIKFIEGRRYGEETKRGLLGGLAVSVIQHK